MILPEDAGLAWVNMIGMACVLAVGGVCAFSLHAVGMHSVYSGLCIGSLLFAACLLTINRFCPDVNKLSSFGQVFNKALMVAGGLAFAMLIIHFATFTYDVPAEVLAVVVNNPKPTGSMSFPEYGAGVLVLAAIMLFTMDNFLGLGWVGLVVFGRSYDWDEAYTPLHRTIVGHPSHPGSNKKPAEEMEVLIAEDGGGSASGKEAEI